MTSQAVEITETNLTCSSVLYSEWMLCVVGPGDLEADVWKRYFLYAGPSVGLWKPRLGVWVPKAEGLRGWVTGPGTRNGG